MRKLSEKVRSKCEKVDLDPECLKIDEYRAGNIVQIYCSYQHLGRQLAVGFELDRLHVENYRGDLIELRILMALEEMKSFIDNVKAGSQAMP